MKKKKTQLSAVFDAGVFKMSWLRGCECEQIARHLMNIYLHSYRERERGIHRIEKKSTERSIKICMGSKHACHYLFI